MQRYNNSVIRQENGQINFPEYHPPDCNGVVYSALPIRSVSRVGNICIRSAYVCNGTGPVPQNVICHKKSHDNRIKTFWTSSHRGNNQPVVKKYSLLQREDTKVGGSRQGGGATSRCAGSRTAEAAAGRGPGMSRRMRAEAHAAREREERHDGAAWRVVRQGCANCAKRTKEYA